MNLFIYFSRYNQSYFITLTQMLFFPSVWWLFRSLQPWNAHFFSGYFSTYFNFFIQNFLSYLYFTVIINMFQKMLPSLVFWFPACFFLLSVFITFALVLPCIIFMLGWFLSTTTTFHSSSYQPFSLHLCSWQVTSFATCFIMF